ncbi:hypothetical protein [Williamsia sp. Leaf354]|uniref:hypothetical protein n=1 Tax=Williamsia sp. Leaf354 TaxID=1736349 RepID=UPI0012E392DF|nr:hypothetical protein [Williamsia sp. Leaf354]
MHRTARRSVARLSAVVLAGVAAATGVVTAAGPASAASVTVRSPIEAVVGSVDVTSTTVDYDRATGRLDMTIVVRTKAGVGRGYGPNYSVLLYGPRNVRGGTGQAVAAISAIGRPLLKGFPVRPGTPVPVPLIVNPVGTDQDQIVQVPTRIIGNRVEFRVTDNRLKNLPLRYFDVQTSLDRNFVGGDFATTDTVRGRLPN